MDQLVEIPEKLGFLFEPHRYKVAHGGRGSGKSWGFADALLIRAAERPTRVLCAREIQKSIADSVHQLLSDRIAALNLGGYFEVQNAYIHGRNGSQFSFAGLKHNVRQIKSHEGVDVCWVEEAEGVSNDSWNVLIPTIRKPNSEIWISFNPLLGEDVTYQRFVVKPPASAQVVKMTHADNPWFPDVLDKERLDLLERDPVAYDNVWEGNPIEVLEGAVYGKELRQARADGRITRVPVAPAIPVETAWDIGYADSTAIWFFQRVGFELRVVDYYEASQETVAHYLKVMQDKGYLYGMAYLPHDAYASTISGNGVSVAEQVQAAGIKAPSKEEMEMRKYSLHDGVNSARSIFPACYFDEERCADGLSALRHYCFKKYDDRGTFSKNPEHSWASHAADAFRYLAIATQTTGQRRQPPAPRVHRRRVTSWMS